MKPSKLKSLLPSLSGMRGVLRRLATVLLIGLPLQAAAVDLLVSNLTDTPDPAVRGGNIVYAASVTNNTIDVANNVTVVFGLHAQTAFVGVNDPACLYAAGPHTVTCSYPTLQGDVGGGGTADIKNINVTVRSLAGAGSTVNFSAAVSTSDVDSNPGNNSLTQTTTIDNGADLSMLLTGNPTSVAASGNVVYTAATFNNGPNAAGLTTAKITLSPNLAHVSTGGSGWNCSSLGQVVTCTRATAALGAQPDITINTKVTGAVTGTISNTAVVSIAGGVTDFNNANDSSVVNTTVTDGTDLSITKTVSAPSVGSGQPLSYTLAPRNLGPFTAANVSVTDSVPAGFTAISASGTGWSCNVVGNDVTCTRASYAVGAAADITVLATAPPVVVLTTLSNSTTIGSTTPDGVPANNTGSVNVNIVPDGVDLSITKSKTPNPVAQGGAMTTTLRVTNLGPRAAAAGEVSIVETLPVGETYVGKASGSNWNCSAVGQVVTCLYTQALALNAQSQILVLTTTATDAGTLTNTACAVYTSAGLADPVAGNNCASASAVSTPTLATIDLQLAKVADTAVLAWNAPSITYTLTVTNLRPSSATGVVLADPIPGFVVGKTVVTASRTGGTSAAAFNCTTGATVTCTQTGGSIDQNQTAIFTVVVSRPLNDSIANAGGVWTNTASVNSTVQGDVNPANNTASASVQVDAAADITVFNTVNPTTVLAGTSATYVVTINNNGPSRATNVTISDVFTMASGGMTFLSAIPSSGSCAAFNTATQTLNCNVGNMTSGATATITVVVRPDYMIAPPSPRTIISTASVLTSTQESDTTNNSAAATLTVTQASLDLLINSSDNIDPLGFVPGGLAPDNVVTYRNIITNRGPSVASKLKLTFVMKPPAGKTVTFLGDKLAAGGPFSNYCDNLGISVTGPGQQTITCNFPGAQILLASNATTDLLLDFHVDTQPDASGDSYASTVSIEAAEPESTTANNDFSQTTTIKMRVDLQLTKGARAQIGGVDAVATVLDLRQPFYWVLTLTNAGPGHSQVTNITDTLPAGLTLYTGNALAPYNAAPYNTGRTWSTNNSVPTSGSCSGTATISCSVGLLESGKVATVFIPVVANSFSAPMQNCAAATTSEVDANPANNSACATVSFQRSSIAGTVYADGNNDGLKTGAEAGIAGVAVRLNGTDNYGNAVVNLPLTTDASGNYVYSDRSAGTYTITEVQPVTHLDGKEAAGTSGGTATGAAGDSISAITLPINTAATGYLFGEVLPASVSGFVFIDRNTDAVRNLTGLPATDESAGITSVGLTLTGTDDLAPVNLAASSGINGAYSFTNLRPGTYQLVEATLGGVTHTGMTIGSKGANDGATPLAANTPVLGLTKRTISNIALVAGDADINNNFGESGQGLGGVVYADANNNGIKDAGEPGIGGVSITLSGNTIGGQNVCVAISPNPCTILTDASGAYTFAGLPASDAAGYSLTEQSQASAPLSSYGDGIDTVGTVNGVASGSMTNDKFSGVVITTGTIGTAYNFGEISASIAGKVYLDVDRSNTLNGVDTPIAAVSVTLSGTTATGVNVCTLLASCVRSTDVDGNFSFIGLPASNGTGYTVVETQPVDYVDATNAPGTGATTPGGASVVGGNSVFSGIVLGAGQAGVNYLYGEAAGSISGFVYHDANNDGVKDAGETGIAGATVTLSGTAAGGGTPCGAATCVVTSGADGSYTFSNVRNANAGGYVITETQPVAYLDGKVRKGTNGGAVCAACVDTVSNVISALPFNAANASVNFNFGEVLAASIAGRVYVDINQDALAGAGEQLGGVSVTLTGTNDLGAAVNVTVVTAADGSYLFSGLRPSNGAGYTVTETHPVGYSDFPGVTGSQTGAVNATTTGTAAVNAISGIVIASNGVGTAYNFREIGASISGVVYFDADGSNSRNGGDTGMGGITVTLTGAQNRSTVTDASGAYSFTGLVAGSYAVVQQQPNGYTDGADLAGTSGGTVNAPKNSIVGIALAPGAAATGYLFGEKAVPTVDGSLAGTVYVDANKNGIRDVSEVVLPNVTVTLTGIDIDGTPVKLSVLTDAKGNYLFPVVRTGSYTLAETQPAPYQDFPGATGTTIGTLLGGTPALNGVTVLVMPASGGKATGYDFRELLPVGTAKLGGIVYVDGNQNGKPDAGEPLANVPVTIDGVDSLGNPLGARTVLTGPDGSYLFDGLPAGTFFVVETQPAGYGEFPTNTGSAIGNVGGVLDAGPNKMTAIVLGATTVATNYNFREPPNGAPGVTAQLGGIVYVDVNRNGKPEAGEPLADVTVTLTGVDTLGNVIPARSMQTGPDGSYLFVGLPAGTYTVVETQPVAYGDFPTNTGSAIGNVGGVLDAGPNKISGIVLGASTIATDYNFREASSSLAGIVYRDDNHNGVKDAGEPVIPGVTVTLNGSGKPRTAVTGVDGGFLFTGLPADTYKLVETQAQGYTDGKETVGTITGLIPATSGGASSGALSGADLGSVDNSGFDDTPAKNSISAIKLGVAQDGTNYLFGERRGRLQGYVYMDNNHNGVKDPGEAGLPGVHVTLSGTPTSGGDVCATTNCVAVTGPDGLFAYDNVLPGNYTLVETQTDLDTARIQDGKETAGVAGGKVDNSAFGTAPALNTISGLRITPEMLAANNGLVDGYLFGERVRTAPGVLPPIISGYVWLDRNHTRERPQDGPGNGMKDWTVTLTQNGKPVCTVKTDANGFYQFDNLRCAGYQSSGLPTGSGFDISFTKEDNNMPNVATSGGAVGEPTIGKIRNITLKPGDEVTEQNLPLDPSGIVYDSTTRLPVAGAVVSFTGPAGFDPARHLLGGLPALTQTTGPDGMYQFYLLNNFPAGQYKIVVTTYPAPYVPAESVKIPACVGAANVGAQPNPALVQRSDTAPALSVPAHKPVACVGLVAGGVDTTQYYSTFAITPTSAQIQNNHIPLDPTVAAGLALTKTGDKQQIEFGETLGYTVTVKQTAGTPVAQASVRDSLPAGFTLVPGTVKVNGKAVADPKLVTGPVLVFNLGPLASNKVAVLTYRLRAGVGSLQGDGINRAIAYACGTVSGCVVPETAQPVARAVPSNTGIYKVRLSAGVFTEKACVAGKVYIDCNGNHVQDSEELGVPGVRLYLEDGTAFTTDVEGKFSFCGLSPKSHVIKADSLTLPRGSSLATTSNRNLGDANSLWLDAKNGELLRADFAISSCSAPVIEQTKARRSQGGTRAGETEKNGLPGLKFDSKPAAAPRQATDSANQEFVKPRQGNTPAVSGESRAQ